MPGGGICFLAKTFRFFIKAVFEGFDLFDAASLLHGAAPFHQRKAGALRLFGPMPLVGCATWVSAFPSMAMSASVVLVPFVRRAFMPPSFEFNPLTDDQNLSNGRGVAR